MTLKALSEALGVTDKTIRNQRKKGFTPVNTDSGTIDIELSVKAYVAHQSEIIRQMSADLGRNFGRKNGISDPYDDEEKAETDWKKEKEKQSAIKIKLANDRDMGLLLPLEAFLDLYNAPLTLFRGKVTGIANDAQKRISLTPEQVQVVSDVSREALESLREKDADELQSIIEKIVERYSRYYSTSEEDGDHSVV